MGERTRYEPGTFCWAGLATSDPAAATAFYARLFDWEAETLPAGEPGAYTIMRRVGHDVTICYRQTAQARAAAAPPHWTSYISVEDADATAARRAARRRRGLPCALRRARRPGGCDRRPGRRGRVAVAAAPAHRRHARQ